MRAPCMHGHGWAGACEQAAILVVGTSYHPANQITREHKNKKSVYSGGAHHIRQNRQARVHTLRRRKSFNPRSCLELNKTTIDQSINQSSSDTKINQLINHQLDKINQPIIRHKIITHPTDQYSSEQTAPSTNSSTNHIAPFHTARATENQPGGDPSKTKQD